MLTAIQSLFHFILNLFGGIQNHTKSPELDGGAPDEVVLDLPVADTEGPSMSEPELEAIKPPWFDPKVKPAPEPIVGGVWGIVKDVLDRPFQPAISVPSSKRYEEGGVYDTYGRAPKETGNKDYPKAKLKVHTGLAGDWNNGKAKLYMEKHVGVHLREGLLRAEELEKRITDHLGKLVPVVSYIVKMGSYSYRHIRHNPENELSFHSWAIAFDLNPSWNRGITYAKTWQKRTKIKGKTKWIASGAFQAQRGPVAQVLPYSKQYNEVYPKTLPVELVMAFKSVYFTWGGDWGRSKWQAVVAKFGTGYDQTDPTVANSKEFKAAMREWKTIRYLDPMHFELTKRGDWAEEHYARMLAKLETGSELEVGKST
jgi:hypothetical protein